MKVRTGFFMAAIALAAAGAQASTPFAGEDFDGNTGALTGPSLADFSPDNSGQTVKGTFGGSRFDLFGIISRADDPPFDLVDDSLDSSSPVFESDEFGILHQDKTDNVVALGDTVNGDNPNGDGSVQAQWTFDITGRDNLELSIDMAMLGDFDTSDSFDFTYTIDAGSSQDAMILRADETNPSVLYSHTDQSGTSHDRDTDPFFSDTDWQNLIDFGPGGGIDYHPFDDDENGFIEEDFAFESGAQVRAYADGDFTDEEFTPFQDPLFLNGDSVTGTQLTAEITTYTVPLSGTGDTLTLTLDAVADGSLEYFVFDNIVLAEGDGVALDAGDFNGDGRVDNTDLNLLLASWGDATVPPEWTNGFVSPVENGELNALLADWGNGTGANAVPEPSAAALAALAGLGLAARRR